MKHLCRGKIAGVLAALLLIVSVQLATADVTVERTVEVSTTGDPYIATAFNEDYWGLDWTTSDTKTPKITLDAPDGKEIKCNDPVSVDPLIWTSPTHGEWGRSHTYTAAEVEPTDNLETLFTGLIRDEEPVPGPGNGNGDPPEWKAGVIHADIQTDANNTSTAFQRPPSTDPTERAKEEVAEQGGVDNPTGLIVPLNRGYDQGGEEEDYLVDGIVTNDPDLVRARVVLNMPAEVEKDSKIQLFYNDANLRVYKGTSYKKPDLYDVEDFGKNNLLYVEGVWPSASTAGDHIRVRLIPKNKHEDSKDEVKLTVMDAAIINPERPTWGKEDISDDIVRIGNVTMGGDLMHAATLVYTILPEDLSLFPTKSLTIYTENEIVNRIFGDDVKMGKNRTWEWDGKEYNGDYLGVEEYTAKLGVRPETSGIPFSSRPHQLIDLGVRHKPEIRITDTEYSPPVNADYHLENSRLLDESSGEYVYDYCPSLHELLSNYNEEKYYAALNYDPYGEDYRRATHTDDNSILKLEAEPAFYVRTDVHNANDNGQYQQWAFVQYWMYESASTLPVGTYGGHGPNPAHERRLWHEGDWEFFQVVVRFDTDDQVMEPWGASYSIHYYGVSLPWEKGTDLKQVHTIGDYTPQIYVASGGHATYPFSGSWHAPYWPPGNQDYTEEIWTPGSIGSLYDYCAGFGSELSYSLIPLEKYANWKGRWGIPSYNFIIPGEHDHGPPSPRFRTGGYTNLYTNPHGYFNNMLPPDQEFQDLAVP